MNDLERWEPQLSKKLSKKSKYVKTRGSLSWRWVGQGQILEVWIPPVDNPEGEMVLWLHRDYLADLAAVLNAAKQKVKP